MMLSTGKNWSLRHHLRALTELTASLIRCIFLQLFIMHLKLAFQEA